MTPTSPDDQRDFKERGREELDDRETVEEYEIVESSPTHMLVKVTEQTTDSGTRTVLYRIQDEPRPEGGSDIHWAYLGPVADDDDGDTEQSNP